MFRFQLVTITGSKFDGDVYEVVLPTLDGQIGVLAHHMPLISVVTNGLISVRKTSQVPDNQVEHFATYGGVIEVENNTLRVLVDEADNPDEINEAEAKKALELAQKMKKDAKDQVSLDNAQSLIDRQSVRLKVAGMRRHQRRN
jgi:F-type H+-transporting ATPase subunit epsilon